MRQMLMGMLLVFVCASGVMAGEPWWAIFCPPRLKVTGCPNDYCDKPMPCLPPEYCPRGCDDYCKKPMPCLPPEYCPRGCADYRGKPAPWLMCELPWMKCYPTDGCCRGGKFPNLPIQATKADYSGN